MTAPKPLPYVEHPDSALNGADRAAYAAGLRHIAHLVETGQAPIPYHHATFFLAYGHVPADEQPTAARDLMRALGGGKYDKTPNDDTLDLTGMCGGVPVRIYVDRKAVCERVVVGTETVELPAQEAQPARTETRELVEWICSPLLAVDATEPAEVSA